MTSSQLCSVKLSSSCFSLFQLWQRLLSSSHLLSGLSSSQVSQLFSTALIFFISSHLDSALFTFSPLFSTLLNSSELFSTLLNSSHLLPPLLNSSHLFSPPLISSHLFLSSSQLFSPLVSSSQLLPSSSQLFSPLFTEILYTEKLLHTASLFPREAFAQRSLCTDQAFYTEKLLHTASFCIQ